MFLFSPKKCGNHKEIFNNKTDFAIVLIINYWFFEIRYYKVDIVTNTTNYLSNKERTGKRITKGYGTDRTDKIKPNFTRSLKKSFKNRVSDLTNFADI